MYDWRGRGLASTQADSRGDTRWLSAFCGYGIKLCENFADKLQEVSGSVLRQNKKEFIINLICKIGRMR